MNLSLIIALVLAFGLRLDGVADSLPRDAVALRSGIVGLMALSPVLLGLLGGWRLRRRLAKNNLISVRSRLNRWDRALSVLSLVLFGVALYALDWPLVVEHGFGLQGAVLLDEALILLPFLVYQVAGWLGLAPVEAALRSQAGPARAWGRLLVRRARSSFGLVVPAALAFALMLDGLRTLWPASDQDPTVHLAGLAVMGASVLALAPALVRLAWPTASMPPGPLRDRLTQLARRLGFRYTDILVWDTDHTLVNAGVTGALPWFRYVLLTDTLIETLDDEQIEAVFGHEVGHVAHRHLAYFGFFFLASMGLMALVGQGVSWVVDSVPGLAALADDASWSWTVDLGAGVGWLLVFLAYVLLVFGFLSRRFERQADVYGCRAVSCGRPDCPPHGTTISGLAATPLALCPTGIQTFAAALTRVAFLNGMEPRAGSWRHGSIRDRVAFLEGLAGHPEHERRFQSRVRLLRIGLTLGLLATLAVAIATGALEQV
jgi:STE24 endopeptidase